MDSINVLKDLSRLPLSDKEIVLELIKEYGRVGYNCPLDNFINAYMYIVKQVGLNEPVLLEFTEIGEHTVKYIIPS